MYDYHRERANCVINGLLDISNETASHLWTRQAVHVRDKTIGEAFPNLQWPYAALAKRTGLIYRFQSGSTSSHSPELHSRVLTAASFGVGIMLVGDYCWRVISRRPDCPRIESDPPHVEPSFDG